MTKEDWESIKNKLCYLGARAHLKVDGYNVTLCVLRDEMKMVIAVYVNGKINWNDVRDDCDIRRRFYQCRKHSLLTAASKKKLAKERKSVQKAVKEQFTYYSFTPYWNSFRSLKNHFIKNNESIEICEEESA